MEQFCNTYKFNHNLSDDHYFIGDIAKLNERIEDYADMLSDITLVCGGPPCQGFLWQTDKEYWRIREITSTNNILFFSKE